MFLEDLIVRLLGDGKSYEAMLKNAIGQTQKMAEQVKQVGAALTKYITVPIVTMGALSLKSFSDFNSAMTESTALIGPTAAEIDQLKAKALQLGAILPMGPTEAAHAYYELFAAGLSVKQSLASLEPVMRFASAGAFSLQTATALAEGALSALGMMSKDTAIQMANLTRITDVLVKSSVLVSGSVEEFGRALTRDAGAVLKVFNKDVEEGVAVLAAYHRQQIRGALAGNTFGRMMRLLAASATKNAAAFKKYGIAVFDAQGNFRNVADILQDFERATKGLSDAARTDLLDKLGLKTLSQKALTPLIGMSESIRKYEKELRAAGGTTKAVSDRQLESFSNQMKILKNQLAIVGIEIGEMLIPVIKFMSERIKQAIAWWKALSPEVKKTILVFAGLAAAIGPVLLAVGGVLTAVISMVTTITTAAATIGSFIAAVALPELLLGIAAAAAPLIAIIGGIVLAIGGFIAESGGVEQAWVRIQAAAKEFIDWITPVWESLKGLLVSAWPIIVQGAIVAWQLIRQTIENTIEVLRLFVAYAMGDVTMSWTEIRDTIVFAFDMAAFALENFEMAARYAAINIAQYFLDMADRMTFGISSIIDDFTLGIGQALEQEEAAIIQAFEEFKRKRAELAKQSTEVALAVNTQAMEQAKNMAGTRGLETGQEFARGVARGMEDLEASIFGSADYLSRLDRYLEQLRRAPGTDPNLPLALQPNNANSPVEEDAGDIVDALGRIEDLLKGDDGNTINVEGANVGMAWS